MDQNVRDDVFGSTLDQHVRVCGDDVWNLSWFLSLQLTYQVAARATLSSTFREQNRKKDDHKAAT